jgi:hypothetical protein
MPSRVKEWLSRRLTPQKSGVSALGTSAYLPEYHWVFSAQACSSHEPNAHNGPRRRSVCRQHPRCRAELGGIPLFRLPRSRFAVVFPANPQVEATTYQIADNRSVPAHIYSVRHNDTVLQVTVS